MLSGSVSVSTLRAVALPAAGSCLTTGAGAAGSSRRCVTARPAAWGQLRSSSGSASEPASHREGKTRWPRPGTRSAAAPDGAGATSAADSHDDSGRHRQAILPAFHLAFPVRDISEAREFYGSLLGCPEGRSAATWIDFNLYGHQIVCHHVEGYNASTVANDVDGDCVPVPHFGLAMAVDQFHEFAQRLRHSGVEFEVEPHMRFQGQPGEQWTMFFKDPSGNALEFKAMTNPQNLFAKYFVE